MKSQFGVQECIYMVCTEGKFRQKADHQSLWGWGVIAHEWRVSFEMINVLELGVTALWPWEYTELYTLNSIYYELHSIRVTSWDKKESRVCQTLKIEHQKWKETKAKELKWKTSNLTKFFDIKQNLKLRLERKYCILSAMTQERPAAGHATKLQWKNENRGCEVKWGGKGARK